MEANLPKVEHRISLLINHTSITHICPLPQLFFWCMKLWSVWYIVYCVQCTVLFMYSLYFVCCTNMIGKA